MKLSRPRGMRDFLPEEMLLRRGVIEKIREVFESFGFGELDTPAMEHWEILSAKCGEEVLEQIYAFEDKAGRRLGLRFDLTVPLARVAVMNPGLPKPFKRYAIGKAWRYEEPQSGRLREFLQADADIVGCPYMDADAEVLAVAVEALKKLGLPDFEIRLNNRKVLEGLAREAGVPEGRELDAFRALDKLDKIGVEGVLEEFEARGLGRSVGEEMLNLAASGGEEVLAEAEKRLAKHEVAAEGLRELREILELAEAYGYKNSIVVDLSLARGLDYYTGPIYEVKVKTYAAGSVAGGGRYDKLIEILGGPPTPATGISLGVERIVEVLKEARGGGGRKTKTQVFVAVTDPTLRSEAIKVARELRSRGVCCELDLMQRRLSRQLEYADSKGIPLAVIVGRRELERGLFTLKDLRTWSQKAASLDEIAEEALEMGRERT
ncbi:MAG: histidine--tRNA ligase [Candidatus Verstraetearchaeota archaeon]|nr:histidine--tRNA ligase [Candidatus Verstraetearchaeota archaeon]